MNTTHTFSRGAMLAALAVISLGNAARAQITFNNRAAFIAATPGASSFNFNGFAPPYTDSPPFGVTNYPGGITVQGLSFTASADGLNAASPGPVLGNPFGGEQFIYTTGTASLDVALPAGVTAFGADFSNYGATGGATVTATVITMMVNGVSYTFNEPGDTSSTFFGVVSTSPITSLSFVNNDSGTALDNVRFKQSAAATPEPGGVALLVGIMTISAGLFRKRRA